MVFVKSCKLHNRSCEQDWQNNLGLLLWKFSNSQQASDHQASDMWAAAASSSLTALGDIEVIFPGLRNIAWEGRMRTASVSLLGRHQCGLWAVRHGDSLYLLYLGNRPDATSNSHNHVIMVPPPPPGLSLPPSLPFLRRWWVTEKSPIILSLSFHFSSYTHIYTYIHLQFY